jgi:hypothetical protein
VVLPGEQNCVFIDHTAAVTTVQEPREGKRERGERERERREERGKRIENSVIVDTT